MKRVIAVDLFQAVKCGDDIEITAYYAGHVLGAAMFHVKVGEESVLYTGDYNTTPDRHLGAAQSPKLRVDLLITETTYATTIRDSKRLRERDFLKRVHETVARGGKVLIPVFALGRAQELCILIETYWERMGLNVPVYFSAGLVERANLYYKLFINWTNQKIKNSFVEKYAPLLAAASLTCPFRYSNIFDFKHIKAFERSLVDAPGPMVLFATPGMLHAGTSLDVFKKWCGGEKNTCILPGYCVNGTVGAKILAGERRVDLDKRTTLEVNCQVASLSFSAHADAKGIMQLISQCEPKNVMLCHGERNKMQFLKQRIHDEFGIPCYDPANGETLVIQNKPPVPVDVSRKLLKLSFESPSSTSLLRVSDTRDIDAVVVQHPGGPVQLLHPVEASQQLGVPRHTLSISSTMSLPGADSLLHIWKLVAQCIPTSALGDLEMETFHSLQYRSILLTVKGAGAADPTLTADWDLEDDELADAILEKMQAAFGQVETDIKRQKT